VTDSRDKPKDVLSFSVTVSTLPKAGMPVRFEATPKECAIVASLLEIPAIERLTADLSVKGWRGGGAKVTGTLTADVVQTDVVTLDPLHQKVQEEVDLVFVPENSRLARLPQPEDGELHLDPEGDDIPETFSGDQIDLGLVLTEILALGLDPYPRGAGTSFDEFDTDPEPDGGRVSPFAALARLKPDRT
jgi:hypothetical protein